MLKSGLSNEYHIELTGESNSTRPDVNITKNGQDFKKIEAKSIPSAAGVQTVVEQDSKGRYISNQDEEFTKYVVALANLNIMDDGKSKALDGYQALLAFDAFERKYASNEVALFIGQYPNELFVACKPTKEELAERFIPRIEVRNKKSGSTRLPKYLVDPVKNVLQDYVIQEREGKAYLLYASTHKLDDANAKLEQASKQLGCRIQINKHGEIRRLGTTEHVTAILSLDPKPNLHDSFFLTDEEVTQLVVA